MYHRQNAVYVCFTIFWKKKFIKTTSLLAISWKSILTNSKGYLLLNTGKVLLALSLTYCLLRITNFSYIWVLLINKTNTQAKEKRTKTYKCLQIWKYIQDALDKKKSIHQTQSCHMKCTEIIAKVLSNTQNVFQKMHRALVEILRWLFSPTLLKSCCILPVSHDFLTFSFQVKESQRLRQYLERLSDLWTWKRK